MERPRTVFRAVKAEIFYESEVEEASAAAEEQIAADIEQKIEYWPDVGCSANFLHFSRRR